MDRPGCAVDAELDGIAPLLAEVGVADQELLAPAVRPEREKLVDRRRPLAVRDGQAGTPAADDS